MARRRDVATRARLFRFSRGRASPALRARPVTIPPMDEFLRFVTPAIPEGIPHWWYYLCVGLAVLITGISKAGFGGGVGILAIPVMTLVVGPKEMLGITLPLLIACDVFSNLHHLGYYDWKRLRPLLLGLAIGVVVGTFILYALKGRP